MSTTNLNEGEILVFVFLLISLFLCDQAGLEGVWSSTQIWYFVSLNDSLCVMCKDFTTKYLMTLSHMVRMTELRSTTSTLVTVNEMWFIGLITQTMTIIGSVRGSRLWEDASTDVSRKGKGWTVELLIINSVRLIKGCSNWLSNVLQIFLYYFFMKTHQVPDYLPVWA